MDKQKEFLDKVLEKLKSETEFKTTTDDGILRYWWKYPFGNFTTLSPYYPTSQNSHFYKHCRDIYGLSNKEIEDHILPNYYKWFKSNNPIYGFSNPEMLSKNTTINENTDKLKNFYDKVLDRIVRDTNITDSWITFPFANFKNPELSSDSLLSVSQWIDGRWENHKYPHRFSKYCMDIYGLTYMESLGLWNSYMEIIEKEILKRLRKNKSNVATIWNMGRHDINESVDKQKEFLDKVVQHMIERFKDDEENKWESVDMKSFVDFGENFGLTDLELNYVYHKYYFLKGWNDKDISSWYLDKNTSVSLRNRLMNESMDTHHLKYFIKDLNDKQKNYINKVIEHLVNDTEIDYPLRRIHYPFKDNHTGRKDSFTFSYIYPFSGPFIRYCNNLFPLSKDEMKYVHGMYIANIYKKVSDYFIENDLYHSHYNVNGTKDIISFDQ